MVHRWPLPHGGLEVDRARMRSDINAWRLSRAFFFYTRALMRMRRGEPPVYFAAIPCRNDAGSAALLDREYFCRIRRKRRSFYSRDKKEYRRALYWQREKRLFNLRFLRILPRGWGICTRTRGVGSLLCPAPPASHQGKRPPAHRKSPTRAPPYPDAVPSGAGAPPLPPSVAERGSAGTF